MFLIFLRQSLKKNKTLEILFLLNQFDIGHWFLRDFFYFWATVWDLEKQEGCGVVAHERLTEPRVTKEWLLAKPRSCSNLPVFLNLNGTTLTDAWSRNPMSFKLWLKNQFVELIYHKLAEASGRPN